MNVVPTSIHIIVNFPLERNQNDVKGIDSEFQEVLSVGKQSPPLYLDVGEICIKSPIEFFAHHPINP